MLKTVIITDKYFGYDLKNIGYPISNNEITILKNIIEPDSTVYVDTLMYKKLSVLQHPWKLQLLSNTLLLNGYILSDCAIDNAYINCSSEVIIMRKFRAYPHLKTFSISNYSDYNDKPSIKKSYMTPTNIRIDEIHYTKKEED